MSFHRQVVIASLLAGIGGCASGGRSTANYRSSVESRTSAVATALQATQLNQVASEEGRPNPADTREVARVSAAVTGVDDFEVDGPNQQVSDTQVAGVPTAATTTPVDHALHETEPAAAARQQPQALELSDPADAFTQNRKGLMTQTARRQSSPSGPEDLLTPGETESAAPGAVASPPGTPSDGTPPVGTNSVGTPQIVVPPPSGAESTETSALLAGDEYPIDLVSVIRLVNDNSPAVGYSYAKVQEAQARAEAANLQWLPNLSVGMAYNRFDGQTQNQRGEVFGVSRSNLFANGGVGLNMDLSEAIYRPLIEQRLVSAEQQRAEAASLTSELEAILAYLELLHVQGLIEINSQTLQKGEALLTAAQNAQRARLDRSAGDVNRVQTEILLRRQERVELRGRSGAASARLAKHLLLSPTVRLVPQQSELVPITLVNSAVSLDGLVQIAIQNRPDLAASHEILGAAWERVRKAQRGPLLPKLQVQDQGGVFGGGTNADLQNFGGRNSITGLMYWELKNLGYGNRYEVQEREAGVDQARYQLAETQARVSAEVVESAQVAAAKLESLTLAEQAVNEAAELYRINQEGTFNVVDAKNLFDALRPLQALQLLHTTRQAYLAAMLDYTRAQYRLYSAIGCPQQ